MRFGFVVIALIYGGVVVAGDFAQQDIPSTPQLPSHETGYVAPLWFDDSEEEDLALMEQEQMEFWLPIAERGTAQEFAAALVEHEISQNVLIKLKQLLSARSDLEGPELSGKLDIISYLIRNGEDIEPTTSTPHIEKSEREEPRLEYSLTESELLTLPLWFDLIDSRPPADFAQELETNDISETMMAVLGQYLRNSKDADAYEKLRLLNERVLTEKARPEPQVQPSRIDALTQGSLLKAIMIEDLKGAFRILKNGTVDLHEEDIDGNNALHWLMWINDKSRVVRIVLLRKMIKVGLDCNHQNNQGETPLHLAHYSYKQPWLVAELLCLGADSSRVDKRGRCPLLSMTCSLVPPLPWITPQAVQKAFEEEVFAGKDKNIEKYVELGAKVNKVDQFGMTPLQRAAFLQKPTLAKKLIAYGAITGSLASGSSPYEFALLNASPSHELFALFKTTARHKKALQCSLDSLETSCIHQEITEGAPINMAIDDHGNSLFSSLVDKASGELSVIQKAECYIAAKWLVLHGANPCLPPISRR